MFCVLTSSEKTGPKLLINSAIDQQFWLSSAMSQRAPMSLSENDPGRVRVLSSETCFSAHVQTQNMCKSQQSIRFDGGQGTFAGGSKHRVKHHYVMCVLSKDSICKAA